MSGHSACIERALATHRRMVELEAEREARERAERYAAGLVTIDDFDTIPADADDPNPVWVRLTPDGFIEEFDAE
jgi:hypothetical protein